MLSPNRRPMHRMGSAGFWRSCTPIVVCASRLEPAPSTRTIQLLTNRSCGAERHSRGRSPLQKKWILPRWGRFLLDEVKTVEVERWLRANWPTRSYRANHGPQANPTDSVDSQGQIRRAGRRRFANEFRRGVSAPIGPKWTLIFRRGFGQLIERNGRHEETRTPDLYRVKVAL